jgi:hypothetical protein
MPLRKDDENRTFLYKYKPLIGNLPGSLDEFTEKLLQQGELFFSKPSKFNDPFDTKVYYSVDATKSEVVRYFKSKGMNPSDADSVAVQIENGTISRKEFSKYGDSGYADEFNIFCLSRDFDNILMWSHYAKEHTGICIGFSVSFSKRSLCVKVKDGYISPGLPGFENNLLPAVDIKYDRSQPKPYNIFKSNAEDITPFLLAKSSLWEYEKEMRLLVHDNSLLVNPVLVPKTEIGEIMFGLKTPPELDERVKLILKGFPNSGQHVKRFKMVEVSGRYELERVEIT